MELKNLSLEDIILNGVITSLKTCDKIFDNSNTNMYDWQYIGGYVHGVRNAVENSKRGKKDDRLIEILRRDCINILGNAKDYIFNTRNNYEYNTIDRFTRIFTAAGLVTYMISFLHCSHGQIESGMGNALMGTASLGFAFALYLKKQINQSLYTYKSRRAVVNDFDNLIYYIRKNPEDFRKVFYEKYEIIAEVIPPVR